MWKFITQHPVGVFMFILAVFLLGAVIDGGLEILLTK